MTQISAIRRTDEDTQRQSTSQAHDQGHNEVESMLASANVSLDSVLAQTPWATKAKAAG